MEYYSNIKKNEMMLLATTWMHLEVIILSEVNQTKANINHPCVESNWKWYKWTYKAEMIYSYWKQIYGYQGGNVVVSESLGWTYAYYYI